MNIDQALEYIKILSSNRDNHVKQLVAFNGKLFLVLLGVLTSIIVKPDFFKLSTQNSDELGYSFCVLIVISIVFLTIS